jgi:hypothetical protein
MKISKLYNIKIKADSTSFSNHVLVDQNTVHFGAVNDDPHNDDKGFQYSAGLLSERGYNNDVSYHIKDFDKNNLQDSTFYRTPKLALPQNKMQLLKDKYNIKVVRDKEKADYIITSDKYIEGLTEYSWNDFYSGIDLKHNYLDKIKGFCSEFIYDKINDFIDHVISEDGYIRIQMDLPWSFKSPAKDAFHTRTALSDYTKSFRIITDLDMMTFIIDNEDILVKDTDLINYCNEDSIVLSPEDCKSISAMVNSDDRTNQELALEMMANCNIEKSFDKVALIFAFYQDRLRYCNNWNSVNVKSLRKQMSSINYVDTGRGHGFNYLVKALHAKGALTPFAVGVISNKMCKTILNYVGLTSEHSVFDIKPKDLKLKSQYSDEIPF